LCQREGFG